MNDRIIKKSYSDLVFDIINYSLLVFVLFITLYPLIFVLSASFSSPNEVWAGKMWLLPKGFNVDGYKMILNYDIVWIGYRNTIFYTLLGTSINLFMTITGAYPLSRKDFLARNFLMAIYTFTMFFSGGLIPTYLVVKNLGMLDTVWALVIPGAVSTYNLIVTRTYFQSNIPDELKDASVIDGCNNVKFLTKVVLPLSAPIISVMALFYGVGHWNAFFDAYIYLSDRMKSPLQVFLREILIRSQIETELVGTTAVNPLDALEFQRRAGIMKYAIIVVSIVPMMLIYPLVQKHFIKGVMIGAIKG